MRDSTFTFSSLEAAFQQVRENHGCAGVDGVTIEEFELALSRNLAELENELKRQIYSPLPLLKILVDKGKGNDEARALCVPTVRDRVVQTAVLHAIEPLLEEEFEDCSFAFRKGRSVKQAVYKIKSYYNDGYRWVVDSDIDAFFDSVDHGLLMKKVVRYIKDKDLVRLIELWIGAEVWDGKGVAALKTGIPQGSPISPILANLFLDELDEEMMKQGQKYVRFADDFLILCKSPNGAQKALAFTTGMLDAMLLELDESDIVSFDEGFKFLGVTFVKSMVMVPFDRPKKEHRVLYYPPPMNMAAYYLKKKKVW